MFSKSTIIIKYGGLPSFLKKLLNVNFNLMLLVLHTVIIILVALV